jgi:hypothetical protein
MQKFQLIDWYTLLVGLKHGWCNKKNLINYGEQIIGQTTNNMIDGNLAIIASGEMLSVDELISVTLQFLSSHKRTMNKKSKEIAVEKWRFAHLYCLLRSGESEQQKIDKLQEIYAEFGYPEDMSSCSIYNKDSIDPLIAAENVVKNLSQQLNIGSIDL